MEDYFYHLDNFGLRVEFEITVKMTQESFIILSSPQKIKYAMTKTYCVDKNKPS